MLLPVTATKETPVIKKEQHDLVSEIRYVGLGTPGKEAFLKVEKYIYICINFFQTFSLAKQDNTKSEQQTRLLMQVSIVSENKTLITASNCES